LFPLLAAVMIFSMRSCCRGEMHFSVELLEEFEIQAVRQAIRNVRQPLTVARNHLRCGRLAQGAIRDARRTKRRRGFARAWLE